MLNGGEEPGEVAGGGVGGAGGGSKKKILRFTSSTRSLTDPEIASGAELRASSHGRSRCPERLGFLLIFSDSAGETPVIILWDVQIGKTSAPPATQDNVNIQENVHVPASVCLCVCVCLCYSTKRGV